jgi:hypothetical protein
LEIEPKGKLARKEGEEENERKTMAGYMSEMLKLRMCRYSSCPWSGKESSLRAVSPS